MMEVNSRTNNSRELFLGFQLEHLNIVCHIECSRQQSEKFVCHFQHFLFAVTHLRLIATMFFHK